MKPLALTLAALFVLALCGALTSCADLAGLTLSFDEQGNATFQAPPHPLVIPAK